MLRIDVERLRDLLEDVGERPVLSAYLPVDPSDPDNQRPAGREKWRVDARNRLAEMAAGVADDRDARIRLDGIVARVAEWLADHRVGGRTVVLLADDERLIHVELPIRLKPAAGYGPPLVAGLMRAMCDHRLYAAVLVDRESARLVEGYLGYVEDAATLELSDRWGMPGETRSGHQFRFEARREEYQRRYHRDLAEQIEMLVIQRPEIERLVIGGNEREAHGVAGALGQRATERLIGVAAIPVDSSEAETAARIAPLAAAFEEDRDLDAAARLSAAAAAARAVLGAEDVLRALAEHRARTVLVAHDVRDASLLESLSRGAVMSGAAMRFLHGAAARELEGGDGVAALLYYGVA